MQAQPLQKVQSEELRVAYFELIAGRPTHVEIVERLPGLVQIEKIRVIGPD